MAKAEWGNKRQCPGCGARFYDLGHIDPIVCIKCATEFTPEILLKPRRGRPDDKIAAVVDPAVAAGDDDELETDDDAVTVSLDELAAEEVEDDDEDAAVIAILPEIDGVDEDLLADGDESDKGLLETEDDDEDILPTPSMDD